MNRSLTENKLLMNMVSVVGQPRALFPHFPGHALHENSLQRQIRVGTLVSSQERRALAVPLMNRWSIADFVPPSVYIGFRLFVLPKRCSGKCFRFAGGHEGRLSPGGIDPTAFRPTQPRSPRSPAVRGPTRPACSVSGFWIRQMV